jgi:uncharacterized protein (TIGR02284 family)
MFGKSLLSIARLEAIPSALGNGESPISTLSKSRATSSNSCAFFATPRHGFCDKFPRPHNAAEYAQPTWSAERSVMATETVSTLNNLIETLKDGEKGFQSAGAEVKDPGLKATFEQFAQQRARFARELQSQVATLGGKAETTGSATAAAHRGWINIKSALGGGEKSILNEAERGEDAAVKSYEKAINEPLPEYVAGVVRRQFAEVKQAHDEVRDLRDSWIS